MELNEVIPEEAKVQIETKMISDNYRDLKTWGDLYKLMHSQMQYIYCLKNNTKEILPN